MNNRKRKNQKGGGRKDKKMPHLPSSLRRELGIERFNREDGHESNSEEELHPGDAVYEYDEPLPQEESKKNRRFDHVDNLEYELPESFRDEEIDEDLASGDDEFPGVGQDHEGNDDSDDESEDFLDTSEYENDEADEELGEEDDERHTKMIEAITGMPGNIPQGMKRSKKVVSETLPESEYNLDQKPSDGNTPITIQDLLDPLQDKAGYSNLRKRMQQLEKNATPIQPPLPRVLKERLERKVAYKQSKDDITKWEPIVKKNRVAPTIYFDDNTDVGFSTVGAVAAKFEPRTDFEKKMATLLTDSKVMEAHREDGSKLLEFNAVSVEDVRERQNRLAKMRSLLFRHELKAKHLKKIKSKTYHRMLKRDRLKSASAEMEMDPEAAKEYMMKQEFKRAEERMTLKHKNSSKWAKRILKRGLKAQDEGTRAAIAEQLHQHELLTRKMNSMKDSSSSDESSEDDDEGVSKLIENAKEETTKLLDENDIPKSGVMSLPFMVRGIKKRKMEAYEEARLALEEYDSSLKREDDDPNVKGGVVSGRRVFGEPKRQSQEPTVRTKSNDIDGVSDSEDDFEVKEKVDSDPGPVQREAVVDLEVLREESERAHDPVYKSFDDIEKELGPKTTYDVAIFTSGSFQKRKYQKKIDVDTTKSKTALDTMPVQDPKETDDDTGGDEESEGESHSDGVDSDDNLPTQSDLIHRAFAGDDVEEEFEKEKLALLNEEIPEPEKLVMLPGWGQWTDVQRKKGLPSWMVEEHESAKKKREDALKKRKDANLKHVIISERVDKKAAKFHAEELPFPYKSKEVFEQSIRVPLGPDYNPTSSFRALVRPSVVKKPGVIINPIKLEEVRADEDVATLNSKQKAPKSRSKNNKRATSVGKKKKGSRA
ncbi:hypothetical protein AMTRI_Chr04g248760 [Amborella trichopoda]